MQKHRPLIGTVNDALGPIDTPFTVTVTPDGTTAFAANHGNNTVSVIDIATQTVTGIADDTLGPFALPNIVIYTPDGSTALITNESNNSVSVMNILSICHIPAGYTQKTVSCKLGSVPKRFHLGTLPDPL